MRRIVEDEGIHNGSGNSRLPRPRVVALRLFRGHSDRTRGRFRGGEVRRPFNGPEQKSAAPRRAAPRPSSLVPARNTC